MTTTITGLFDRYDDAEVAVGNLETAGIRASDISIVANNGDNAHGSAVGEDAGTGAGAGAVVGAAGGLLTGLGIMAIPGVGPVVAAGWLAATAVGALAGAAVGGVAGGIVGAMTKEGVPEADANVYAEGVRRGGVLVVARVDESRAETARLVLEHQTSVNVADRRRLYEAQGWSRFDERAPAMEPNSIKEARDRPML